MIIQISNNPYEELRQSLIKENKEKEALYEKMKGFGFPEEYIIPIVAYFLAAGYAIYMGRDVSMTLCFTSILLILLIIVMVTMHRDKIKPIQEKIYEISLENLVLETTSPEDLQEYLKKHHWNKYCNIEILSYIKEHPDAVKEMYFEKVQPPGTSIVIKYDQNGITVKGTVTVDVEETSTETKEDILTWENGTTVYTAGER